MLPRHSGWRCGRSPRTLERVIDDPGLTVTALTHYPTSPVSPVRADLLQTVERITNELWPGVPVVPVMSTGGTLVQSCGPTLISTFASTSSRLEFTASVRRSS
jgi:hypothetical protein